MLNRRNRERGERAEPLSKTAVVYVREPFPGEENYYGRVPSADEQRVLCRLEARAVGAEVIGEFADEWFFAPEWTGLTDVAQLVKHERPLFVIVSSWDRLAGDYTRLFHLGWRLASSGTIVLDVERRGPFPWKGDAPSS